MAKTGLSIYPQDRSELLRYWHERWQKAKRDLEEAQAHLGSIKEDLSSGLIGADGGYAYRRALMDETAALIEYSRVLRIYTDLAVHDKIPDEPKSKGTAVE